MAKHKKSSGSSDKGSKKEVDFDRLRRDIAETTRRTFAAIRSRCADEKLYAFALYSDGDAMTVCPAANTEEAYRRAMETSGASEPEQVNYYRWAFPEWSASTDADSNAFAAISDRINGRSGDRYDEQDPNEFVHFKAHVYATMVLALLDLVNEGFFGSDKEREQLTLLCSEPDSGCHVWLEDESARRLNSSKVYKRFRKQWKTYLDKDDLKLHQKDPDDIYLEFVRYLDGRSASTRRE